MASVCNDPKGTRRIQFVSREGGRKTIRLGKISERDAESICRHVEELLSASINGQPVSRETSAWLAGIGNALHDRLARVALVTPRVKAGAAQLGPYIEQYIAGRSDLKPGTVAVIEQAKRSLLDYFRADKPLAAITPGDADAWRAWLVGQGLADATARKRVSVAKQLFRAAVRRRMIAENPFADLACAAKGNAERLRFITRDQAQQVLDACPDAQWRLLFALSRYGGLRCPSEHLALQWGDIDWERGRMTIRSAKTAHHEGKATRVVPIFPELRPYLMEVFDEAEPGEVHVITRYRQANCNLRTQLERIIRRAGLESWPRLFQNLRSSRETELAESFPEHVICQWIGNSVPVARRHYLQVTDGHFAAAIAEPGKAAQNPAQYLHAHGRTDPRKRSGAHSKTHEIQGNASKRELVRNAGTSPHGFEP